MVQQLKDKRVKYIWFDYHAEVKKVDSISKLVQMVNAELKDWGHFMCEMHVGLSQRADITK
jgi:hypothetical protein